jgi:hypothetical protein
MKIKLKLSRRQLKAAIARSMVSGTGTTLLRVLDGASIYLTAQNSFFVVHNKIIFHPYLRKDGAPGNVVWDWDTSKLPKTVMAYVKNKLIAQAAIRAEHALDFDEDEAIYTYW